MSSNPKSMMSAKEYKEHLKEHCKFMILIIKKLF